jgi:hypothetical protein
MKAEAMTTRTHVALLVLALAEAACDPDAKTFSAAWEMAKRGKDAAAAWALVDRPSRDHLVEIMRKAQERAKSDSEYRTMVASTLAPADVMSSPEEMAEKLFASHLQLSKPTAFPTAVGKGRDGELTVGERVTMLHLDKGVWRAEIRAVVLESEGAPVVVQLLLPQASEPATTPLASASSTARRPAPSDIWVPEDAGASLEPVQEVTRESTEGDRRLVVVVHRTPSRGVVWSRKKYKGSAAYYETDYIRHTLSVANDAMRSLSRFSLLEDNSGLRPDRRTEEYNYDPATGNVGALVRISYLDAKTVLNSEKADDKVPALFVLRTQKDSEGRDLAKMEARDRDKLIAGTVGHMVDDAIVGFRVHATEPGDYSNALTRAAELTKLPEGFIASALRVMLFEEGRIGSDPNVRDASFELRVLPEARVEWTETAWDPKKVALVERKHGPLVLVTR